MKVLLTGFEPFGGEEINPAYEAIKNIPDWILGANIIKAKMPTVFTKVGEELERLMEQEKPDVVLCIGQAGGRASIGIEKVAINLRDATMPDNEGVTPCDEQIRQDGATAYFATIPIKAVRNKIQEQGIPAVISYTAGTYVCNDLMYNVLYLAHKEERNIRGGFVHVPFIPQQVSKASGNVPSMSLEMITKAIFCALEAILQCEEDLHVAAGTIM